MWVRERKHSAPDELRRYSLGLEATVDGRGLAMNSLRRRFTWKRSCSLRS
jgi:hypothetical protein